jgi:hypothetical protein
VLRLPYGWALSEGSGEGIDALITAVASYLHNVRGRMTELQEVMHGEFKFIPAHTSEHLHQLRHASSIQRINGAALNHGALMSAIKLVCFAFSRSNRDRRAFGVMPSLRGSLAEVEVGGERGEQVTLVVIVSAKLPRIGRRTGPLVQEEQCELAGEVVNHQKAVREPAAALVIAILLLLPLLLVWVIFKK